MSAKIDYAISLLISELKKNQEYYYNWQSDISMAFYNEWLNKNQDATDIERVKIHAMANLAAKGFLNNLIKQTKIK